MKKKRPTIAELKKKIEKMRIRQVKRDALKGIVGKAKDLFGNE